MVEKFEKQLKLKGIELNELQRKQFACYANMLVEWNMKMNLTSITDEEGIYMKHFYDSLILLLNVRFQVVYVMWVVVLVFHRFH